MKNRCPEKGENTASSSTDIARPDQQPESNSKYEVELQGRRRFILAAGGLTAATLATGVMGLSPLTVAAGTHVKSRRSMPGSRQSRRAQNRRAQAEEIRRNAAVSQLQQNFPEPMNNGDEDRYPTRFANFSKALPHNKLGEVDLKAYQKLLQAIKSGEPSDFDAIPLGGTVKLANPQAAFAFDMEGADPHSPFAQAPPRFASEEVAGEMAEDYWLALARDIPYSQHGNEPVTAAAIEDLRRFSGYEGVNARNLFRGDFPSVHIGPYISQFLLQPYFIGSTLVHQRYRTTLPGTDHITSYRTWLDIQNGNPAQSVDIFDDVPRYVRNGRDLGEWSHRDFIYQGPLIAALILLGFGNEALADTNPYKHSSNQSGGTTFGAQHILDHVARVANLARKAAWYQKWAVHRRLRPEEFGGRIHNHLTGAARYPIHSKLLDSPALVEVFSRYGTYLLPQAYPEGCPADPAFVNGHAATMGAGATVLKAFFDESFVIPNPVVPSDDGLSLLPWKGEPLRVGNELNKLAFNIAFGRATAGVHYGSDERWGILVGEFTSLSVMRDFNTTFNEDFEGLSMTRFDGTPMTLAA